MKDSSGVCQEGVRVNLVLRKKCQVRIHRRDALVLKEN